MKSFYFKRKVKAMTKKNGSMFSIFAMLIYSMLASVPIASAQAVLFDFDNAPIYTPLPITQSAGGITASFTATGQGFSIQDANVLGFTPAGFSGHIIYPNSVYLADLLIAFDQPISDFSIMYTCQELGCDDAATMRVTAYMNGNLIGTNTKTASIPGTWPVDTLSCGFAQGFNSVVVHYDSPPPTCQDYGVIFMADNMRVTALSSGINNPGIYLHGLSISNPVSQSATISFTLLQNNNINIAVYDYTGRLIKNLFDTDAIAGKHQINWNLNDDAINPGLYFLTLSGVHFIQSVKFIVVK